MWLCSFNHWNEVENEERLTSLYCYSHSLNKNHLPLIKESIQNFFLRNISTEICSYLQCYHSWNFPHLFSCVHFYFMFSYGLINGQNVSYELILTASVFFECSGKWIGVRPGNQKTQTGTAFTGHVPNADSQTNCSGWGEYSVCSSFQNILTTVLNILWFFIPEWVQAWHLRTAMATVNFAHFSCNRSMNT